jgi:hypothetical protein
MPFRMAPFPVPLVSHARDHRSAGDASRYTENLFLFPNCYLRWASTLLIPGDAEVRLPLRNSKPADIPSGVSGLQLAHKAYSLLQGASCPHTQ